MYVYICTLVFNHVYIYAFALVCVSPPWVAGVGLGVSGRVCPGRPAGRCRCCRCNVAAVCVGASGAVLRSHRRCSGRPGLGHISKPASPLCAGARFSYIVCRRQALFYGSYVFGLPNSCWYGRFGRSWYVRARPYKLCLLLAPGPRLRLAEPRLWGGGLTLSWCSWRPLVDCVRLTLSYSVLVQLAWPSLAAGFALCLGAVGIAWFHACLVHRAW